MRKKPRVLGPDGQRCKLLEHHARECLRTARSRKVALRDIEAVLDVVSTLHAKFPDVLGRLLKSFSEARSVLRQFVTLKAWSIGTGRNTNALLLTFDNENDAYRASITLTAMDRLYQLWIEAGIFKGRNPIKMSPEASRMPEGRERTFETGEDGEVSMDVDRWIRVVGSGRRAPRSNDPRFLDNVMAAGAAFGWPPCVVGCVLAKGDTGGRDFQLRPTDLFKWVVLGKERFITAPNKWKRGRKNVRLRVTDRLHAVLVALVDYTYPGGMAEVRRLATTSKGRQRLKKMPLFTLNGVTPISYSCLNDSYFRPAMEMANLQVLNWGDGDEEPFLQWVTMHWLRHEFTNRILDRIAASAHDEKTKLQQQVYLARYMGWRSGKAMLLYYGAWHFNQETDALIASMQEGANDNATPAFLGQYDTVAFNDNEKAEIRKIAGGLVTL